MNLMTQNTDIAENSETKTYDSFIQQCEKEGVEKEDIQLAIKAIKEMRKQ